MITSLSFMRFVVSGGRNDLRTAPRHYPARRADALRRHPSGAGADRRRDQAAWRYVEFFAANIRNANTRRAYARACQQFFAWCDERGLTLMTIRPVDVARYIETRQQ